MKLVIDYAHGLSVTPLSELLYRLAFSVTPLNGAIDLDRMSISPDDLSISLRQLAMVVRVLDGLAFGVWIEPIGEKCFVVDDQSRLLSNATATAVFMFLLSKKKHGNKVIVPDDQAIVFDGLASRLGYQVVSRQFGSDSLMEACCEEGVVMGTDGDGRFIFPEWQPLFDALYAVIKLAALLLANETTLSAVVDEVGIYLNYGIA